MKTWVLILLIYSRSIGAPPAISVESVPGFKTAQACGLAKATAEVELGSGELRVRAVCLEQ